MESHSNLWSHYHEPMHRVAISTNGFVKANGRAVMGRGCALEAAKIHPELPLILGNFLKAQGNVPFYLWPNKGEKLMVLPVKHNWWQEAAVDLIAKSLLFLNNEALLFNDWAFHVPRLGCGNGRLSWENVVKPMMQPLPDNVWVHSL